MKKNVLFVCNHGFNRSGTSADLIEHSKEGKKKYNAKHVGTNWLAIFPVSSHAVKWADIIICMEEHNKEIILKKFPEESKNKIFHVLHVSDFYIRGSNILIKTLKPKLAKILKIKFEK